MITEKNYFKVLMMTESLSAEMVLQDKFLKVGKRLFLVWVPGHIGEAGNERAVAVAK